MMITLRFNIVLDNLESLSNRTVIIGGSPKMFFHILFELREFLPKQVGCGPFELHGNLAER
jgi:hypothetical protein